SNSTIGYTGEIRVRQFRHPTATAASIALPPRCMISTPTREAISLVEATIPCRARAGSRDAARGAIDMDAANNAMRRTALAFFFIVFTFSDERCLPVHPDIPCDQLLAREERDYRRRTEKDSKRDLHLHITTAKRDKKYADQ